MQKWKVVVGLGALVCLCSATALAQVESVKADDGSSVVYGNNPSMLRALSPSVMIGDPLVQRTAPDLSGATVGQTRAPGDTPAEAILVNCNTSTALTMSGMTISPYPFGCKNAAGGGPGVGARWFKFQASTTFAFVGLCEATSPSPSEPDSLLAVYSAPPSTTGINPPEQIGCDDDSCGAPPGYLSSLNLSTLSSGNTYWIQTALWGTGAVNDGNYLLKITCCLPPPTIVPETGDGLEQEYRMAPVSGGGITDCGIAAGYFPWYFADVVNGGCNMAEPAFTEISCGQWVYGTTVLRTSVAGRATRDTDWYRIYLINPAKLKAVVRAQFGPVISLEKPHVGGLGPCDLDPNDTLGSATGDICSPVKVVYKPIITGNPGPDPNLPNDFTNVATLPAGEYWIVVTPDFSNGSVACGTPYRLFVAADPCDEPKGACCESGVCTFKEESLCTGSYYGDGIACPGPGTACFSCPAKTLTENEPMTAGNCDGYIDTYNSGCGGSTSAPPTLAMTCGQTYCGKSGTYVTGAAGAGDRNHRDNDWYSISPIASPTLLHITGFAEFPVEIAVWAPNAGLGAECTGARVYFTGTSGTWDAPAGAFDKTVCVRGAIDPNEADYYWIIIRPQRFSSSVSNGVPGPGVTRELPCGMNYWLKVDCTPTDPNAPSMVGACCLPGQGGCLPKTLVDCTALSGTFAGCGTTCADMCCVCKSTNTPENETACDFADGYNSSCFYLSGDTPPTTGPGLVILTGTDPASPNQVYCGNTTWANVGGGYIPEIDCYQFDLAATGDMLFSFYSQVDQNPRLVKFAAPGSNSCTGVLIYAWNVPDRKSVV